MIKQEKIILSNREIIKTYSDLGFYIANEDGVLFSIAVDVINSPHTYTETNMQIPEKDKYI